MQPIGSPCYMPIIESTKLISYTVHIVKPSFRGALHPRIPRRGLRRNRLSIREGRPEEPARVRQSGVQEQTGRAARQPIAAREREEGSRIVVP